MTHALIREALKLTKQAMSKLGEARHSDPYIRKWVEDGWPVISQAETALEALTTQGWRTDMENAPRDGRKVLLLVASPGIKDWSLAWVNCARWVNYFGKGYDWDLTVKPLDVLAWAYYPELPAPPTPNED